MQRRALILFLSCLAVVATAVPASANVASFTVGFTKPVCKHTGGQFGSGKLNITAHFEESGGTGTNYFRSIAQIQRKSGSTWVAYNPKAKFTSSAFPATTVGHFLNLPWKYSFHSNEVGPTYRVQLIYEFWHKQPGPDQRLTQFTRVGPNCNT